MAITATRSSNGYGAVGKQAVKGTAVAGTTFLPFRTEGIKPEQDLIIYPEGGAGRDPKLPLRRTIKYMGSWDDFARPSLFGKLGAWAFGSDRLDGTTVSGGGSGTLAAQANAGAVTLVPTLASALSPIIVGDYIRIGASFGATTEIKAITAISGTPTGGGGNSTIDVGGAAAGQKVVNVVAGANFGIGDYIILAGGAAGAEIHLLANVVGNVLTTTVNLNNSHLAGVTVVEISAAAYTVSALANTQPIATTLTEMQAPWWHQATLGNTLSWLTVERDLATLVTERIADCKIRSLKISGTAGEPITLAFDFVGISCAEQGSQLTPTYESTEPFLFRGGSFYRDGDALSAGIDAVVTTIPVNHGEYFVAADVVRIEDEEILLGTQSGDTWTGCTRGHNSTTPAIHSSGALVLLKTSEIRSFEITFDNGLVDDIFTNALTLQDILEGNRNVKITFEHYFTRALDYMRTWYADGSSFFDGEYEGGLRIYGTEAGSGTTYAFDLEIPRLIAENAEVHLDPETKPLLLTAGGTGIITSAGVGPIKLKVATADITVYA